MNLRKRSGYGDFSATEDGKAEIGTRISAEAGNGDGNGVKIGIVPVPIPVGGGNFSLMQNEDIPIPR